MIFLLLSLCAGQQLTPIPLPKDGFYVGPSSPSYIIDVFYDHICSDSAAAFPGLYQFILSNGTIGLNIHIFPLSYHPFAFVVAQAGRYIQQTYPTKFLNYLTYMFNHLELIFSQYANWTFNTVQAKVAQYAQAATGISFSELFNALNDPDINWSSRVSWKYATSRGMIGTPQYLINQVWVPDVADYTDQQQWVSFFNNL
jgi:hypothetical protein